MDGLERGQKNSCPVAVCYINSVFAQCSPRALKGGLRAVDDFAQRVVTQRCRHADPESAVDPLERPESGCPGQKKSKYAIPDGQRNGGSERDAVRQRVLNVGGRLN